MVIPGRMLARAFDETASIEASWGKAGGGLKCRPVVRITERVLEFTSQKSDVDDHLVERPRIVVTSYANSGGL